ncbi:hypothetical protein AFCA_013098 [Aspergillus flavus]|nr:hypothetical protein AFCA_013098 [Aspergillus flavus]
MKSAIVSAFILAFLSANLAVAAPQSGGQSVQGSPQVQGGLRPQAGSQPQGGQQPQAGKPVEPAVQAMGPPQKIEQYQQLTKKKMQHPGCRYQGDDCYILISTETDKTKPSSGRLEAEAMCQGTGSQPGSPNPYASSSSPGSPISVGSGSPPGSPNVAGGGSPGSPISVGSGSQPGSPNGSGGGSQQGNTRGQNA